MHRLTQGQHNPHERNIPCNLGSIYLSISKTQRLRLPCWCQGFHQCRAQLRNRQPSVAYLMLPPTAKLRSSSHPNSCKRPRSHSAPWFLALLRNSSHRRPCDARGNCSIIADSPFKQQNSRRATTPRVRVRDSNQKLVPQACSASNLYPFKLTMPSLAQRKRPSSRHSDHRVHPPSIRHRHLKVLFASSLF